jgi:connector enhancer of kinase suppressor of Ras 2
VSCQDVGGGDCEGWLWKKTEKVGLGRKKWMLCWVVLHTKKLYCFNGQDDKTAHGMVYLPGFRVSPAPEVKTKQFAFKVHHTGTTFYFASERQDDMAKWMNKMALATLLDLDPADLCGSSLGSQTPLHAHLEGYETESDEESLDSHQASAQSSPSASCRSLHSATSNHSREDVTDLYMGLVRADLDINGTNMREKRSTIYRTETLRAVSCIDTDRARHRKILSLQRTLKDKEQSLAAIEALLASEPITSESLGRFAVQHPNVCSPTGYETPQTSGEEIVWQLSLSTQNSQPQLECMTKLSDRPSDAA